MDNPLKVYARSERMTSHIMSIAVYKVALWARFQRLLGMVLKEGDIML